MLIFSLSYTFFLYAFNSAVLLSCEPEARTDRYRSKSPAFLTAYMKPHRVQSPTAEDLRGVHVSHFPPPWVQVLVYQSLPIRKKKVYLNIYT